MIVEGQRAFAVEADFAPVAVLTGRAGDSRHRQGNQLCRRRKRGDGIGLSPLPHRSCMEHLETRPAPLSAHCPKDVRQIRPGPLFASEYWLDSKRVPEPLAPEMTALFLKNELLENFCPLMVENERTSAVPPSWCHTPPHSQIPRAKGLGGIQNSSRYKCSSPFPVPWRAPPPPPPRSRQGWQATAPAPRERICPARSW